MELILEVLNFCRSYEKTIYIVLRYKDWSMYYTIPNTPINLGNQYNKFWKNIIEVSIQFVYLLFTVDVALSSLIKN